MGAGAPVSIQAMAWVLAHSKAEASHRLVLLAIANHADAQGAVAWPKVDLLAAEAHVSRRTVFRALEALVALGELEILSGKGRGSVNVYRLRGCATDGTGGVPPVAQGCANGGTQNHKEPSVNHTRVREEKGATVTPLYDPDTLVMDEKGRWFVR